MKPLPQQSPAAALADAATRADLWERENPAPAVKPAAPAAEVTLPELRKPKRGRPRTVLLACDDSDELLNPDQAARLAGVTKSAVLMAATRGSAVGPFRMIFTRAKELHNK